MISLSLHFYLFGGKHVPNIPGEDPAIYSKDVANIVASDIEYACVDADEEGKGCQIVKNIEKIVQKLKGRETWIWCDWYVSEGWLTRSRGSDRRPDFREGRWWSWARWRLKDCRQDSCCTVEDSTFFCSEPSDLPLDLFFY
ncbi:unnamed protein product [Vicia faba]|uniref:Uncharacterized protein n=1 Tax=Vicia faba TaxID=3906 RepID=A0AAV1AXT1_VICFA|nr:unnamed protein product [Vicia faba]